MFREKTQFIMLQQPPCCDSRILPIFLLEELGGGENRHISPVRLLIAPAGWAENQVMKAGIRQCFRRAVPPRRSFGRMWQVRRSILVVPMKGMKLHAHRQAARL
jgi:hypothetical protein